MAKTKIQLIVALNAANTKIAELEWELNRKAREEKYKVTIRETP